MDKNMAEPKAVNPKTRSIRALISHVGVFGNNHYISPIIALIGIAIAFAYGNVVMRGDPNALLLYFPFFVWIILAESWNIAGGYAGLLNLGLVAFFGLGSFVAGAAMADGVPYVTSLLLSGISGAILGVALLPTFRLRSDYFAIGTLVIPFIIKPITELVGRSSNYATPVSDILSPLLQYNLGLLITTLSIFAIFLLMRSRIGIALRAVGDDETASASLGVNILMYKTVALVVSGFIGALAGGYFIQHFSFNTTTFGDFTYSLFPIFMVIVGGIGTFEGPIAGALIFSVINYTVNADFPGTAYDVLLFSLVIMVVAVLVPKGLIPSAVKVAKRIRTLNR
jgi:branched-chain amino acid transport system permease protein